MTGSAARMAGLGFLGFLVGCNAYHPFDPAAVKDASQVQWLAVPHVDQVEGVSCGQAVVSMVCGYWMGAAEGGSLKSRPRPIPTGEMVEAKDLKKALQTFGLKAFIIRGTLEDLDRQFEKGRPVMVARPIPQNPPLSEISLIPFKPRDAHWQVVVGRDLVRNLIILDDPAMGLLKIKKKAFARQWKVCHNVCLVAAPEGR